MTIEDRGVDLFADRCGKWMPVAEARCAKHVGHARGCRTEAAMRRAVPGAYVRVIRQRAAPSSEVPSDDPKGT
jgi:hypothetical protein